MEKKKGEKPEFKPDSVVFVAIDSTGEEVGGVVVKTVANVLYLRTLTPEAIERMMSVPLNTHRVTEVPKRYGLSGLVEAMHDAELINGKKIIPFIPLLSKSDDVLRKLRSKESEGDVIIAFLNHQGKDEIERVAMDRKDPHRFIALGLLGNQDIYLAILKDSSEDASDRERAVKQIISQELMFELALSPDDALAYMAMDYVRDRKLRLRLYLESPRVIKNKRHWASFNSLDSCLEDGDYERLLLDARCYDNRSHVFEYVREAAALERCLHALIERIPTWDMNQEDLYNNANLICRILVRLKKYQEAAWDRLAQIIIPNERNADQCITAALRNATPEERVRMLETLREHGAPGAFGIPPRIKITEQIVNQVCKRNGWRIS